jgi:hypothetical protein
MRPYGLFNHNFTPPKVVVLVLKPVLRINVD